MRCKNVTGATNAGMSVVMSASVVNGGVNTRKATNATAITNVTGAIQMEQVHYKWTSATNLTGATGAIQKEQVQQIQQL